MRHFIHLKEYSADELKEIIELAADIKANPDKHANDLKQKTLIMLFQKTSTRTRLSFESGMTRLGGHSIFLDQRTTQISLTDFDDEIQAIMRFGDFLMFRAMKADDVETAANLNQIPVIDACSEKYHPCQAIGDMLTMIEHANGLENIKKIAWMGIENNVSNTLKLLCAKLGIEIVMLAPEANPASVDEELNKMAEDTGLVTNTLDLEEGLKDVDFIHTDTWMDMEFFEEGKVKKEFQDQYDARIEKFKPFQINAEIVDKYAPQAKIMHCMPCHVGYEITKDAIRHKNSIIFDQAENRMHAQDGLLVWLSKQS